MMRNLLEVNGLVKEYDGLPVLDNLSFQLGAGEKVGLIGRNGSGKSTLLKIIAGREIPTSGTAQLRMPLEQVGYLPQEPDSHSEQEAKRRIQGDGPAEWLFRKYLTGLGFGSEIMDRSMDRLSGGERAGLCLAGLAARGCGLLLLDEPTTHQDNRGMEWLEEYLQGFSGTVLIASHDRYLLDKFARRILLLEQGSIRSYPGNYSAYARIQDQEKRAKWNAYQDYHNRRKRMLDAVNRKKEWAHRAAASSSPRTPYLAARAKKMDRTVKAFEQRLTRLQETAPSKPREYRRPKLNFSGGGKTGRRMIHAEGLGYSFNRRVLFEDLCFTIFAGETAALIGPNGAGKTTLLRLIMGELKPVRGVVSMAPSARAGYLGQSTDTLNSEFTVLQTMIEDGEIDETEARHLLGALLFGGEQVYQKVSTLSGGEKKRLILATLLARQVNLLIMDEPTNHLDVESREAMETALANFDGTVLAVSHDRYFLNRLSDRVLHLAEGAITNYPGSYNEYIDSLKQGEVNPEEILLLENRLSCLSSRLNELSAPNNPETKEELERINCEFIELSRKLQKLR